MADSFNGVSTFIVVDPSQERSAPFTASIRQIPGGNTFYVDLMGQGPITTKLLLEFGSDTDYLNFEAMRGTIGALVCFDTNATALLLDVHRTFRNPSGSATDAEATFVLM